MLFTAKFWDVKLVLFRKETAWCSVVRAILPFSYQINIPPTAASHQRTVLGSSVQNYMIKNSKEQRIVSYKRMISLSRF